MVKKLAEELINWFKYLKSPNPNTVHRQNPGQILLAYDRNHQPILKPLNHTVVISDYGNQSWAIMQSYCESNPGSICLGEENIACLTMYLRTPHPPTPYLNLPTEFYQFYSIQWNNDLDSYRHVINLIYIEFLVRSWTNELGNKILLKIPFGELLDTHLQADKTMVYKFDQLLQAGPKVGIIFIIEVEGTDHKLPAKVLAKCNIIDFSDGQSLDYSQRYFRLRLAEKRAEDKTLKNPVKPSGFICMQNNELGEVTLTDFKYLKPQYQDFAHMLWDSEFWDWVDSLP